VNRRGYPLRLRGIILPQGRLSLPTTPSNDEGNSHHGMKFSEKYELLETLTTGAVETFVAHDKVRGERVLVHIVECSPQKADQTTAEWVLEAFRRQAPEPPGSVLETGKYSGPKYGYVVIKRSDETAVKRWVRQYELQADETKETSVHAQKSDVSTAAGPSAAPPMVATESPQPSVSMTQLFRDFDSLGKSKGPEATAPADRSARKPASSTSLPGESGLHVASPWGAAGAKPSSLADEPPFPAAPAPPKPAAPDMASSVSRTSSKPGEFTSFFQGPFQGDKSAEMPSFSSQPIEPPKKTVGEFTALFGRTTPPAQGPQASSSPSEPSLTSIFKDMGTPQQAFNAPPSAQGGVIPPPSQPLPAVPQASAPSLPDPVFVVPTPVVAPAPTIPPTPQSPSSAVEAPPARRSGSIPGHDATGAFMRPSAEPTPVPVEAPSGPSPYTQIISRPKQVETEEAASGSAATAGGGQFAAPPMPKIPAAAPPPMPKMPAPRLAPPPAPKVKAPPAPKIPKVDAPAPPPVSIWPLIITLTVLFFLAVLLVLYFALRH